MRGIITARVGSGPGPPARGGDLLVPVPAAAASPSQVQVLTGTLSNSRAFVDPENGRPPASDSEGSCQWPRARTSRYPRAGSIFQVSTWAAARQACPCVGASHRGTTGPRQSRPCAYPALALRVAHVTVIFTCVPPPRRGSEACPVCRTSSSSSLESSHFCRRRLPRDASLVSDASLSRRRNHCPYAE
jgi:hypothetical protein